MASMNEFDNVLAGAIADLAKNPTWFSEVDIHAYVYASLMGIQELSKKISTGVSIGINHDGDTSETNYGTNILHCEYGINGIDNARADLVVFDKEDVKNIKFMQDLKQEDSKDGYLQPEIIIEFGTEKYTDSVVKFKEHLEKDIRKVSTAKRKGYIIHLQRVFSKTNNTEKYENWVSILNNLEYDKTKVKVLFLLISTGCDVPIFRDGKVKLYKEEDLKGINMKSYKDEILSVLKN